MCVFQLKFDEIIKPRNLVSLTLTIRVFANNLLASMFFSIAKYNIDKTHGEATMSTQLATVPLQMSTSPDDHADLSQVISPSWADLAKYFRDDDF